MKSARNCTRLVPLNVQFFESARSVWLRPGCRHSDRVDVPYVPSAAGAYAVGSNHSNSGPVCVSSPAFGSPTMFGRPPRAKLFVNSEMRGTGGPELIAVMPAICHSPRIPFSAAFDESRKNGSMKGIQIGRDKV